MLSPCSLLCPTLPNQITRTLTQTEVYEAKCEVVAGELPADLDGVFMRNGSNPFYDPYAGYHW